MDYFYLIFGFLLLFFGGEFLVRSSIDLAFRFKVSKLVIGVTIVSLATSAPELLVSLESVYSGHSDIAFGNVIGSNIANIGLVLALTCMVDPIIADRNTIRTNYPFMILCSVLLFLSMLFTDGIPSWVGGIFIVLLTLFLLYTIRKSDNNLIQEDIEVRSISLTKSILTLIGGSFGLYFGADMFINGAVSIAYSFGVSERIISLSLVAIGTSIPELAASLIAASKKQNSIALGNLIGSNIFNILAVLGVTSLFSDLVVLDQKLIQVDILWMLGFAILIFPLLKWGKKNMLSKKEGVIILVSYLAYLYFM